MGLKKVCRQTNICRRLKIWSHRSCRLGKGFILKHTQFISIIQFPTLIWNCFEYSFIETLSPNIWNAMLPKWVLQRIHKVMCSHWLFIILQFTSRSIQARLFEGELCSYAVPDISEEIWITAILFWNKVGNDINIRQKIMPTSSNTNFSVICTAWSKTVLFCRYNYRFKPVLGNLPLTKTGPKSFVHSCLNILSLSLKKTETAPLFSLL